MARMLPESLPARYPHHIVKVHAALKQIRSEDLVCRISYRLGDRNHPDFLVIYQNRCAFLLAVSGAGSTDLEDVFQTDLLNPSTTGDLLDLPQSHSLEAFTEVIVEQLGQTDLPIQKWILFPKASERAVNRFAEAWRGPPREFLASPDCGSAALLDRFRAAADAVLDADSLHEIVRQFAPEGAFPSSWVSVEEGKHESRSQTDFFLDVDQETAMKRDLELSGEAVEAASRGSTRLITGTAGCGKSLILLLRARLASTLSASDRVLILMHNRPLRADLRARARELGFSSNIEWQTFYGWIQRSVGFEAAERREIHAIITKLISEDPENADFPVDFLCDEFTWISENAIGNPTLEWYLAASRNGRVRSLQANQREHVHRLYVQYRRILADRNLQDWATIPRLFLKSLREGRIRIPRYDWIYVDEAQFFAPIWFECVRQVLHPQRGRLFLAADPTQGFLRSGQSWLQVLGTEVRGRTQRLRKPYRNTRGIMAFARRFYLSRVPEEEDEINLPDAGMLADLPEGPEPTLLFAADQREEARILIGQLRALIPESGDSPNVLVIDASGFRTQILLTRLQSEFGDRVIEAENARSRQSIRITTINACTGIEAPHVILTGADRLLERESALHLEPLDRARLVLENTKKLYVAMTRAAQRLLILYTHPTTAETLRAAPLTTANGSGGDHSQQNPFCP